MGEDDGRRLKAMLRATTLGVLPEAGRATAFARHSWSAELPEESATAEVPGLHAQQRRWLDRLLRIADRLRPDLLDKLLVGLLPDFDAAWLGSTVSADLGEAARAQLIGLRVSAERAAERCDCPGAGPKRTARLWAVALSIEAATAVPESQVDCSLSWATAGAAPGTMLFTGPGHVCAPAFYRYQDLVAMPLTAVHAALVSAAFEGDPLGALQRMPLRARPAAGRCSPNYLRFVVGVSVAGGGTDGSHGGLCLAALVETVRSALVARLRVPVEVGALYGTGLYGSAHHGLRTHQLARLRRIMAGLGATDDLSAVVEFPVAGAQRRRACLTLVRDGSCVAACMLQVPWDESSAELLARISGWLLDRGVLRVDSQTGHDARGVGGTSILAEPI